MYNKQKKFPPVGQYFDRKDNLLHCSILLIVMEWNRMSSPHFFLLFPAISTIPFQHMPSQSNTKNY